MKDTIKILVLVAAGLIIIGAVIFVIAMVNNNWDFRALDTANYVTSEYDLGTEKITDISFNTDVAKIVFKKSDDGKNRVECFEDEKHKHSVNLSSGKLEVKAFEGKWHQNIKVFSFKSPVVTVYLADTSFESLDISEDTGDIEIPADFTFANFKINASTGDVNSKASVTGALSIGLSTGSITLEGVSAASVSLKVSTGSVTVKSLECAGDVYLKVSTGRSQFTDVTCGSFTSEGSTGAITFENLKTSGLLKIKRSTGNVRFEKCDAAEVNIETDTGDVKGSFVSDMIIFASSDTGHIDVPRCTAGGRCDIKTDTGNIKISIN